MRKLLTLTLTALLVASCSSYRTLDLSQLTTGMTKAQVISIVGSPQRVLAVSDTNEGFQEVLEYRTSRDEIYALEFWNDYLVGYEFLYDDYDYIPSPYPPVWFPEYGRPIVVYPNTPPPHYPNRPNQPNRPSRPESARPNPNRPPATRPGVSRPESARPGGSPAPTTGNTSRPSGGSGSSSTPPPTARPR